MLSEAKHVVTKAAIRRRMEWKAPATSSSALSTLRRRWSTSKPSREFTKTVQRSLRTGRTVSNVHFSALSMLLRGRSTSESRRGTQRKAVLSNFHGVESAQFCLQHAPFGIVALRSKRCHQGCIKMASHGVDGNRTGLFRAQHVPEGIINFRNWNCGRQRWSSSDRSASRQVGDLLFSAPFSNGWSVLDVAGCTKVVLVRTKEQF